jgi:8-oxo-dGTP pyrophosphatase MutT (NUDIX family)
MSSRPAVVMSYGIICFRLVCDTELNCVTPEYLMVQRKDSVCFIEFIRGKYSLSNREYIMTLFRNMTPIEREVVKNNSFENIWLTIWNKSHRSFSEHSVAHDKFNALKLGLLTENGLVFGIEYVLAHTEPVCGEQRWEFPKGRRNMHETNIDCAVREFEEETNIKRHNMFVSSKHPPVYLEKMGCNGVLYRGMYFVAKYTDRETFVQGALTETQKCEISCVKWHNYKTALAHLYNEGQRESIAKLNKRILKYVSDTVAI